MVAKAKIMDLWRVFSEGFLGVGEQGTRGGGSAGEGGGGGWVGVEMEAEDVRCYYIEILHR